MDAMSFPYSSAWLNKFGINYKTKYERKTCEGNGESV